MLKNFLKKYLFNLILIIVLIYFEASINLKFAEYISNIINIGVGQSGIEDTVPKYIRKDEMDLLLKVTENDEEILSNYELVEDREKLKEKNIKVDEKIYILKNLYNSELEKLINEPLSNLVALQNKNITFRIKLTLKNELTKEQLEYFTKLYDDGSNMIDILEELPKDLQAKLISMVNKYAKSIDDTVLYQSINQIIVEEYKSLGINVYDIQKQYNNNICKQILLLAMMHFLLELCIVKVSVGVSTRLGSEFRSRLVEKSFSISQKDFNTIGETNYSSITINDTNQIEMVLPLILQSFIFAPIIVIKGLIMIFEKSNFTMSLIIIVTIILAILDILILLIFSKNKFKDSKNISEILKHKSMKLVNGAYVVRAFSNEEKEETKLFEINNIFKIKNIKLNEILCLLVPTLLFIIEAAIIFMIYLGSKSIDSGIMKVGDIVEFIQITIQIIISFLSLSVMSIVLPSLVMSAKRIAKVLKLENEEHNGLEKIQNLNEKRIEFENICLSVGDKKILKNLNFEIIPGKINAIIGETGSGKTSIVNLLLQSIKPSKGKIKIDGKNIENYNLKEMKNLITVSFQENYIFSGTIENNLKLSNKKVTKKKMIEVLKTAFVDDFAGNTDSKMLDFKIIKGGNNISGGQRQRIAIANALAKDFDILILDDSFSSMDAKTEKYVQENIIKKYKGKTIIIISQKISTIKNADQIIVMKKGEIIGIGKDNELRKNCEEYINFTNLQLAKGELE